VPAITVADHRRRIRNPVRAAVAPLLAAGAALVCSLCITGELAAAPKELSAQARFEQTYRVAQSLQVSFLETYEENGRVVRSEAGTAYFRRPGRMRFEYAAPEKNIFLVDGKTAWFYVPADHTATRVPAKESSDWKTPLALLAGEARLSRICSRVESSPTEKPLTVDGQVLQCTLKGATTQNSGQVFLEIAPLSGQLIRVLIRDSGGVTVDFHFKNWDFNPPLPDTLFRFSPPLGTAIVNGELPAAIAGTP
jgi:outer membrane lipoprotein carrier protein